MTALEALLAYKPPRRTEPFRDHCCRSGCEEICGPSGFCPDHHDELRDTQ